MNLDSVGDQLVKAFEAPNVVAVALRINSPGGSPVQSSRIYTAIRELAAEKKVPVYAFTEDVAASGGYYIACAADKIYADDSSIVGSVGVVGGTFGITGVLERWGLERRKYTAGARKQEIDPTLPEDPAAVARLQTVLDDIHAAFKDAVLATRGDALTAKGTDPESVFTGEIFTGRQAAALGLVDGTGASMASVMKEDFGDDVKFRNFPKPRTLPQVLAGVPSIATSAWADALAHAVESAADRSALHGPAQALYAPR